MIGKLVREGCGMSGLFLLSTNPQYLASIRIEDYCLKGATTHHRLAEAKLEPVRYACDGYASLLALCFNSSSHI
jgi:hypothetical protein